MAFGESSNGVGDCLCLFIAVFGESDIFHPVESHESSFFRVYPVSAWLTVGSGEIARMSTAFYHRLGRTKCE